MIELTEEQAQAAATTTALSVIDPRTNTPYVVIREDVYRRLVEDYDDSPWTAEEADALALEAGRSVGWDDMDEYDHYPEKS